MRQSDTHTTSTIGLILDMFRHGSGILQKEVTLAKAEVSQNVSRAGMAIGLMLAAAVMAMICLNLLAGALVTLLVANGMAAGWATLLVAAGFAIVAAILVIKATHDLKASSLMPTQAAENLRRDAHMMKEKLHG